jgi:hypothetical protein
MGDTNPAVKKWVRRILPYALASARLPCGGHMLENLAFQYAQIPENEMRSISYGLVILGGIIGGLTDRSIAEFSRAPYFALLGLIFFSVSFVSVFSMVFIVSAIINGFFWVIVAVELLVMVAGGFFVARVATARSRDAYGHGGMAALAFIPIANFWLVLTSSKRAVSANRVPTIPLLSGGLGVLTGFVLLAAGIGITAYSQVEGMRRVDAAAAAGLFDQAGLEPSLALMAAAVETPLVVDEVTTLTRMEARGTEL